MSRQDLYMSVAFFALIAYLLFRNLPGALIFLRPGWIRTRIAGGADQVVGTTPAMRQMLGELEDDGFEPLGVITEKRPLRQGVEEQVLVHLEGGCYAGVRQVGNEAWLSLISPFSDGAMVITTDYRFPSVDADDYLAGGLPGNGPLELLNAHRRRVQRFIEAGHPLDDRFTLEARAQAGEAFYAKGPGRREIRRSEIRSTVIATLAVVWAVMYARGLIQNVL